MEDFELLLDFDKALNATATNAADFDVNVDILKTVDKSTTISQTVDLTGNSAILFADVEALGDNTEVEVDTSILTIAGELSSISVFAESASTDLTITEPGFVIPPDQSVEGLTQAEWGNAWWKYVLSIPGNISPLFDETGDNANIGQSGPVFYLSGTLTTANATIVRFIDLPTDTFIFFPLLNELDNTFGEDPPRTEEEVIDDVTQSIAEIDTDLLFTEIDGEAVPNLSEQLQISPEAFDFVFPENNLLGFDEGVVLPTSVSGGYWIMLEPLPAREEPYIINFGGTTADDPSTPDEDESVTLDITYIIKTYNQIPGTDSNETLVGTELSDEIDGFDGSDVLIGEDASDALDGGNGEDTLIGVNPETETNLPGLGEIDALTGGGETDTFVLGDVNNVYYNDGNPDTEGLSDYALITDFNGNNDVIQLHGSPSNYSLVADFTLGAANGTGIFLEEATDELIAIVENVDGLNLSSPNFIFV